MKFSRSAQLVTAAALVVAAAVAVSVLLIGLNSSSSSSGTAHPLATGTPAATSKASIATATSTSARKATGTSAPTAIASSSQKATPATAAGKRRLGTIISTGMDASKLTEWVIYGVPVATATRPKSFGFQLSIRHNDGTLDRVLEFGDAGSVNPLKAGFHSTEASQSLEGGVQEPALGYYVGRVARITGAVDGRTVVAKRARWSYNPKVTVFWFDNTVVTGKNVLSSVSAYNAAGDQVSTATVFRNGE